MVGRRSATQASTHCCGWALEIEARRQAPRVDPRLVIGIGFALFAASNFMNITMTNDYAADQLFWPNVVRDVGQALCFAPMSAVATAGIEAENAGSASALFNMMRNLPRRDRHRRAADAAHQARAISLQRSLAACHDVRAGDPYPARSAHAVFHEP